MNPPFVLVDETAPQDYQAQYHPRPSHHKKPCHHSSTTTTTKKPTTTKPKGEYHKHKSNDTAFVHAHKKNEKENAKKPILENGATINRLNETIQKIGDNIEDKINAIKNYVEGSVSAINKAGDDIYQQVGNKTSTVFDKINKKLEKIEAQILNIRFGSIKRIDDDLLDDDLTVDGQPKFNLEPEIPVANVVESQFRANLDNSYRSLDDDMELRTDIKATIHDAIKKAQDSFNVLIDSKVLKINNKINDINNKFENAFNRFQEALGRIPKPVKVFTPPTYKTTIPTKPSKKTEKYTTIYWTPKSTTWKPTPVSIEYTTPAYYRYTVSTPKFLRADEETVQIDDLLKSSIDRIDNANAVNVDDTVKSIDEQMVNVDTEKALEDLQTKILENVKDTLKSDSEDLAVIGEYQSEVSDNPEDKLKSDIVAVEQEASEIENTLAEELRSELKAEEDKLITSSDSEKSQIDKADIETKSDDSAKIPVVVDDVATQNILALENVDESKESFDSGEDENIYDNDGDEMRSVDEPENLDNDEENQKFDEGKE